MAAGKAHGLEPVGLGARDTLRLEMGYMLYGNDIDDTTSPLEAGLGWTVKLDSGDFIGRDVLVRQKERGPDAQAGRASSSTGRRVPRHGMAIESRRARGGRGHERHVRPEPRARDRDGVRGAGASRSPARRSRSWPGETRLAARVVTRPFYTRGSRSRPERAGARRTDPWSSRRRALHRASTSGRGSRAASSRSASPSYATDQLGDVVFVELPAGRASKLEASKPFGVVEAVKTVSDLYAPVAGEVRRGERGARRQPGAREPGAVRRRLDDPHQARRSRRRSSKLHRQRRLREARSRSSTRELHRPLARRRAAHAATTIGVAAFEELLAAGPRASAARAPARDRRARCPRSSCGASSAAGRARTTPERAVSFLGGGLYDHYIPAAVNALAHALRVRDRLHALPARGGAGHAHRDLRVPEHDRRADRLRRRERLALRRRHRRGRGGAAGARTRPGARAWSSRARSIRTTLGVLRTYLDGSDRRRVVADRGGQCAPEDLQAGARRATWRA